MLDSVKEKLKSYPVIHRLGSGVKNCLRDLAAAEGFLREKRMHREEGPIRVGFLCQFIPAWSKLKPVYARMQADDRFEPVLICVPSNVENSRLMGETTRNDTYEEFLRMGYSEAVNALSPEGGFLALEELGLHYIFYPRPYNAFMPEAYHSRRVSRYCRICLVMYGMSMTEEIVNTVMERDFFRYVYLYFAECPYVMGRNREMGRFLHSLGLQKSVFHGLPGMEEIAASAKAPQPAWDFSKNTFRVLWTPRWTTDPQLGGTNFFAYGSVLLDYAKENPWMDFLFRPHPLALENFVRNGDMTREEADAFIRRIGELPNVALDQQKSYFATFWGTSVLVTDISGIMPEYFVTGKPMIYCASNMPLTPAEHTRRMLEGCYVVRDQQELLSCLERLAAGDDPLAGKREGLIRELFGGLDSVPSLDIMEEIAKDREER